MNRSNRQEGMVTEKVMANSLATGAFDRAAKDEVMAYIGKLVGIGLARQAELGNGELELTLISGEVFRLGRSTIARVA